MTLEEKKQQYQKILVEEYRSSHPEETEGLTDEEITLMNPITDADFTFLIGNELNNINKEIVELMKDIRDTEERINTPGVHYQEITECRSDILYDNRRIAELKRQLRLNDNVLRTMFLEVSKKQTV